MDGPEYVFDLTGLRALDCEFASASLDHLKHERPGRREVHRDHSMQRHRRASVDRRLRSTGPRYADGLSGHRKPVSGRWVP